jgi:hypothetical protein
MNKAAIEGGIWLQIWFLCGRRFSIGLIRQANLRSCQCIRLWNALVFPCLCRRWSTGHDRWVIAPAATGQYAYGERETQSR